jgi:hypothetical protein
VRFSLRHFSELAIALSTLFDVTLSYCFENQVLRDSEDDTSVIAIMPELYSKLKEADPFRNDSKTR